MTLPGLRIRNNDETRPTIAEILRHDYRRIHRISRFSEMPCFSTLFPPTSETITLSHESHRASCRSRPRRSAASLSASACACARIEPDALSLALLGSSPPCVHSRRSSTRPVTHKLRPMEIAFKTKQSKTRTRKARPEQFIAILCKASSKRVNCKASAGQSRIYHPSWRVGTQLITCLLYTSPSPRD